MVPLRARLLLLFAWPTAAGLLRGTVRSRVAGSISEICSRWAAVPVGGCLKDGITNLCLAIPGFCEGGEHERCEMPQLPGQRASDAEELRAWQASLDNASIAVEINNSATVGDLVSYTSGQTQLDACEVCGLIFSAQRCFPSPGVAFPSSEACELRTGGCFCAWESGIAVTTADHRILDGHHRWAATRLLANGSSGLLTAEQRERLVREVVSTIEYHTDVNTLVKLANETGMHHTKCVRYQSQNNDTCLFEDAQPAPSRSRRSG